MGYLAESLQFFLQTDKLALQLMDGFGRGSEILPACGLFQPDRRREGWLRAQTSHPTFQAVCDAAKLLEVAVL